ncbi:phosphatase PAP2 family protein [Labilibacter sediminis]|nr:phosphatase PAP2 family protein [Labilibacter sediminis]
MNFKIYHKLIIVAFWMYSSALSYAQIRKADSTSVYAVNRLIEIPVSIGLHVANFYGFDYLTSKPGLTYDQVMALDANDIWFVDRFAAKQDPSNRLKAHNTSDVFMNISVGLPVLLGLDKKIRKDWFDLIILYAETQGINSGIYILNASVFKRTRPFVYHKDVPNYERLAKETRNSFFSGHVSTAACASFFTAKVYFDYHPESGSEKYWLYGAALVPPALVGYYRIRAMKHFPTDVITGTVVGAAVGILVPHLHKRKKADSGLSIMPYAGSTLGLSASYKFK